MSILFKKHAVELYLGLEISPNIPFLDLYSCLGVIWICGLSSHILIKLKISTCTFAGLWVDAGVDRDLSPSDDLRSNGKTSFSDPVWLNMSPGVAR